MKAININREKNKSTAVNRTSDKKKMLSPTNINGIKIKQSSRGASPPVHAKKQKQSSVLPKRLSTRSSAAAKKTNVNQTAAVEEMKSEAVNNNNEI